MATTVSHDQMAATRDAALELIGLTHAEISLVANRTPEIDCLADVVRELQRHDAPAHLVATLASLARRLLELEATELRGEHAIAGTLDVLAVRAHRAERDGTSPAKGIKDMATTLRHPLRVLADHHEQPLGDVIHAALTVCAEARVAGDERILGHGVANQLGSLRKTLTIAVTAMHRAEASA